MVKGVAGVNVPLLDVVLSVTVIALVAATRLPKASSKAAVIEADTTPAVSVCGAVVKAKRLASAALTVSCCVAEARLAAVAVSTGVPANVSEYWKLMVAAPAGIVSGDSGVNVPAMEDVLRLTVNALPASTGLPKESSRATVIVSEATPATRVCGAVVKASWLATAGFTVSCCVAEARPLAAAVIVGVPANGSVYLKLTELAPAGIVNGDAGENAPLPDVLTLTVRALPASTGLPGASSSVRVIVLEAMPAVRVCEAVVKARWLAAAGLTVSFCVAEARPPAEAVIVGVPIDVSEYWKLTVLVPAGMVIGEAGVNVPVLEVLPTFTVRAVAA